jgi:hypothetical protein
MLPNVFLFMNFRTRMFETEYSFNMESQLEIAVSVPCHRVFFNHNILFCFDKKRRRDIQNQELLVGYPYS